MSKHPPTLLIVYLCPAHDGDVLFHLNETLTAAGIAYRLIAEQEVRAFLESAAPFSFSYNEKRMVFALHVPLNPKDIEDLARMVTTGLILGFIVKGEIAMGDDVGVFNNLGG